MSDITLADLQKRAEELSRLRDALAAQYTALEAEALQLKQMREPAIRRITRQIVRHHNELAELIRANQQLFVKPRTCVVDGLKFGLQKHKGRMSWDDDEAVCERIARLAADGVMTREQASMCVAARLRPVAAALEQLDGKLLKRLGITVSADTDAPLIKSVDSEIERAVNAVIRQATRSANAEVSA